MNIEFPNGYEYNLDMQIAHVIVRGIPALRGKGYPGGLEEAEWGAILDTIEDGFKEYEDNRLGCSFDGLKFGKAWDLLTEWFPHLWW